MIIWTIAAFIITISVVVVFHELGHYLACRCLGVGVERFSLGFGKVVLSSTDRRGTEWAVSAIPLGGYVKPFSATEKRLDKRQSRDGASEGIPGQSATLDSTQSIESKSAFSRFIIYAAGPFFSFLLAFLIYTGVNWYGSTQIAPVMAAPAAGSAAAQAGLKEGDRILAINDRAVRGWEDINAALIGPLTLGGRVDISYARGAKTDSAALSFEAFHGSLEKSNLLLEAGFSPRVGAAVIRELMPGSAAERAGLRQGDVLEASCDGQRLDLEQLLSLIKTHPDQKLCLQIRSNASTPSSLSKDVWVMPEAVMRDGARIGQIGVQLGAQMQMEPVKYGFLEGISKAASKTWEMTVLSFKMLGNMLTGNLSYKNLSGPLSIADYSGKIAHTGVLPYISFIAMISLSIGALNLLPIPGLDGGQMLINLIEMIRRRAFSLRTMMRLTSVGYTLLFMLFLLAMSNDVLRLLRE